MSLQKLFEMHLELGPLSELSLIKHNQGSSETCSVTSCFRKQYSFSEPILIYLAEQLDQVRLLYHVFYLSGIYSLFQRRSLVDTMCCDFGILSDSGDILDVLLELSFQCRVLTGKWTRSFALILCSSVFGEFLHFGQDSVCQLKGISNPCIQPSKWTWSVCSVLLRFW